MSKPIQMFVVYRHPSDYPNQFVVRRWLSGPPAFGPDGTPDPEPLAVCNTLDEARGAIPDWCCFIGRYDTDDPAIQEVWI
jgi:hypothetical protein